MVSDEMLQSRAWCVFRNLVQAVYREARHFGPPADHEACVTISKGPLLRSANLCRQARAELKSTSLYERTAQAKSTTDVIRPYREKTELSLDDVINVFKLPNWKTNYGGPKWATIAETLKELVSALEAEDPIRANGIADRVFGLRHNSGPLVPSRVDWERTSSLREKWPELC
jgi:hypothetical protein